MSYNENIFDDPLARPDDDTDESPDSLRLHVVPNGKDWEEALEWTENWWLLLRLDPCSRGLSMGGVVVCGGHARFVFGDPHGQPGRYIECNGQLDFDFALPEDRKKYPAAVDAMIAMLGGVDDSWTSHREQLLALPCKTS